MVSRSVGAVVAVMLAASGCGGDGGNSADSTTTTASRSTATVPTTTTTEATTTTVAPPTASSLVQALGAAGLPIGTSVIYAAETDPNSNLGRPGQYTGKVAWIDTRVDCPLGEPDFTCGGTAEEFANAGDRDQRYEYLGGFADQPPIGGFYMWRLPNMVVRVGYALTPAEAAEYGAALDQLAPDAVEQFEP